MNRKDAPAEVKPLLDILDHYYATGPHACKCKHLVDKESVDAIVTTLRDCYDIFYQPEPLTLQKDWKAESDKWEPCIGQYQPSLTELVQHYILQKPLSKQ